MRAPQKSLKDWGKQKWRTKSGKKSSDTGERYLPEAAIKSLSSAEYAATTRAKRKAKRQGKQFSKQPESIMKKNKAVPVTGYGLDDHMPGWEMTRTPSWHRAVPAGCALGTGVPTGCGSIEWNRDSIWLHRKPL